MNLLKTLDELLKGGNPESISTELLRLGGFKNIPLIPIPSFGEVLDTLKKLNDRSKQTIPAIEGLTNQYTIDGKTATAYEFMFGKSQSDDGFEELLKDLNEEKFKKIMTSLLVKMGKSNESSESTSSTIPTKMSLDSPKQWAMSWTNYGDIYSQNKKFLEPFALTLKNTDAADKEFSPIMVQT